MQAGFGLIHPFTNIIMAWFWLLSPKFTNRLGEDVLGRYLPAGLDREACFRAKVRHYPFTTEDPSRYLEIAARLEVRAGRGTERGGLYLDLRGINEQERIPPGSDIAAMWPVSKQWFKSKGVDVLSRPLEVGVFGHAINGGLRIDEHARTTVPGLYAVGEVSAGPYGADRLGGNMLLNCQVFGARAGRHAATVPRSQPPIPAALQRDFVARIEKLQGRSGARKASEVKREIKRCMTQHLLILRNGRGLQACLTRLREIREAAPAITVASPRDLVGAHEVEMLLDVGELMASAALERAESRGSHFREDYPQRDPAWAGPIFVRRKGERPVFRRGRFA
jgi:succinate dehydrogenase/fumarate reductase flavoprotein subunit